MNRPSFRLKSSEHNTTLALDWLDAETVSVELDTGDLRVRFELGVGEETLGLKRFFVQLAADWRGWEGAREWSSSFEDEVRLTATMDRAGHVLLTVRLRSQGEVPLPHHPPAWQVECLLLLEAGQLERSARDASEFEARASGFSRRPATPCPRLATSRGTAIGSSGLAARRSPLLCIGTAPISASVFWPRRRSPGDTS